MSGQYEKKFNGDVKSLGKTLVLYGGLSAEREISLISGKAILDSLVKSGVNAIAVDVQKDIIERLIIERPDRVFIALHGIGGEDGQMQAVLNWLDIPFAGSGHAASAIAMDKLKTKLIWKGAGLPTPNYEVLTSNSDFAGILEKLGGEVFVKPALEGSSLGMRCVNSKADLKQAYAYAASFKQEVLVETRIVGSEFTVPVLNGVALPPIGLRASNTFYDFDAKYISHQTQYQIPCGLNDVKEAELKALVTRAFALLGCTGWGRIDVMMDNEENFFLLEANTVPGMTSHSLVPMSAKAAGISFDELVLEILGSTLGGEDGKKKL